MPIQKPHARSLALATAALLFALSGTSLVSAQGSPPQQIDLKVNVTTLEEWDTQVDLLGRLTAQVYNGPGSQDLGGHDLPYYWQQYVFTQATKDTLDSLREKAQKQSVAKDTAGLQHTLEEASAILTAEHAKAYAVATFLRAQEPVVFHQYQLGPWLARATDQDRQGISDRVSATYQRLSKELEDAVRRHDAEHSSATADGFFKLIADSVAFFNAERERLVKAQASLPNPVPVPSRARGEKPCPAPVPPTKGRDRPGLGADFPSSEAFYPAAAKQNIVEGAVTLRVTVSDTGCIQQAEIAGTSGVAQLDESALDLAMAGKYVPASGAGDKPVAGTLMFRVKFEEPDALSAPR